MSQKTGKTHEASPHARVMLTAVAEELKIGLIGWAEYTKRSNEILRDDKAECKKGCCKPRKKTDNPWNLEGTLQSWDPDEGHRE